MADTRNNYEILGIQPGDSYSNVRRVYLNLVKTWHPDRFFHDPELQKIAHQKLSAINRAYEEVSAFLPHEETPNSEPGRSSPTENARPPGAGEPYPRKTGRWCDLNSEADPRQAATEPQEMASDMPGVCGMEDIWRYHQAAEQGFDNAQFELGMLYFHGNGVPRDLVESYKWLSLASAAKGRAHLKADHYLERVRVCLNRLQIAEAHARMAPFTRNSSLHV